MDKFRALIVDDERLARQRIRRFLASEPDFESAGECTSAPEAIGWLTRTSADVLFLDIQMPEMNGFDLLEAIPASVPVVIFVTAYDEYALRAFEVNAFDYLLKPFDRQKFQRCVQRARAQLSRVRSGELNHRLVRLLADLRGRHDATTRFAVKSGGRVFFVRTDEIDWIEAADNYVCLHAGAERHLIRETMNSVEAKLDPGKFARIHRSAIVNVNRIKELQPWFRGDYVVLLESGTKLTLSRTYRDRLHDLLGI
jgi:two-component system LytT family response regulator